jgi:release factor glutamine methyltransferase
MEIRVHPCSSAADLLFSAVQALEAAGIEDARFEAQLLLAQALGVSRTAVVAGLIPEPNAAQRQEFTRLVRERGRRVPLAYLRGEQEFYGLPFLVNPAVLIPRPETELLVDFALEALAACARSVEEPPVLADVGTGSGCIAVAVLANCPAARAVAVDVSAEALETASRNARRNGVAERLRFVRGGLLDGAAGMCMDVIVSNPPYIPTSEIPTLQSEVRDFEPRAALDGGADGLVFPRRLAAAARRVLRPDGRIAVEVAMGQAETAARIFHAAGLVNVERRRDLAGIERVVCGKQP